jgi:hypothetical protein
MDKKTAIDTYNDLNNAGLGFAIGEDDQTLTAAAESEGWIVKEVYSIDLIRVTDAAGHTALIGGDGMGRNAWAIWV